MNPDLAGARLPIHADVAEALLVLTRMLGGDLDHLRLFWLARYSPREIVALAEDISAW